MSTTTIPPLLARRIDRPERVRFDPVPPAHYADWPSFWAAAVAVLRQHGYARSTVLYYRQIIRAFARFAGVAPDGVTADHLRRYLATLGRGRCTWHWTGMNLSVLRTLFDKIGGLHTLTTLRGPRRARCRPGYLDRPDIERLLAAAPDPRDRTVIALFAGCGLKTGELRALKGADLAPDLTTLRLPSRWGRSDRRLPIPEIARPGLAAALANPDAPVFPGPDGRPLTGRSIQLMVRRAGQMAGLPEPLTPLMLRHSYALLFLSGVGTIRHLQENLDHALLSTTARYLDLLPRSRPAPEPPPPAPPSIPPAPRPVSPWTRLRRFFASG